MTNSKTAHRAYGEGDATFQAMGGEAGVRALVDEFYTTMENTTEYQRIWDMHPPDRDTSRDKLSRFLCAWMGGPRLYREKYGSISIPGVHAHLPITMQEHDMWLNCMRDALKQRARVTSLPNDLIDYLLVQFAVPAGRIVAACSPSRPLP